MSTDTKRIDIALNGEQRNLEEGLTLTQLLHQLGLHTQTVVVEHNRVIVRGPALETTTIRNGDKIELVHFVGGG